MPVEWQARVCILIFSCYLHNIVPRCRASWVWRFLFVRIFINLHILNFVESRKFTLKVWARIINSNMKILVYFVWALKVNFEWVSSLMLHSICLNEETVLMTGGNNYRGNNRTHKANNGIHYSQLSIGCWVWDIHYIL